MAQGKKYSDELKEQAFLLYATCGNYKEVGRELGIPYSTVRGWIESKPPDALDKLRNEKKAEFIEKAAELIDIALERLKDELTDREKAIPVNHLTTVIGTLYDKRALAKGESTGNTAITVMLPEGINDYAE